MDTANNAFSVLIILVLASAFYFAWFGDWARKGYRAWMRYLPSAWDRPVMLKIFVWFFKALTFFLFVLFLGAYVRDRLG